MNVLLIFLWIQVPSPGSVPSIHLSKWFHMWLSCQSVHLCFYRASCLWIILKISRTCFSFGYFPNKGREFSDFLSFLCFYISTPILEWYTAHSWFLGYFKSFCAQNRTYPSGVNHNILWHSRFPFVKFEKDILF